MDTDGQNLITQFANLPSILSRRAVYHGILDQFTHHEWRDVRDRLRQISFRKDILGFLPLEVVVRIVKDLNLADVHILRRVSKKWLFLLSSEPVCGTVYRQYAGHNPKLHVHAVSSPQTLRQYARQRVRLERGQPLSRSLTSPGIKLARSNLDYTNGRYAWIDEGSILVHDLRTQNKMLYCTPNRETFVQMRISEYIVAGITPRGYCHIWDLHNERSVNFRIPSLNFMFFIASGYNVAIAFNGTQVDGNDSFVLQHGFRSCTVRKIDIAPAMGFMTMNPMTGTIITVHLENNTHGDDSLRSGHPVLVRNAQLRVMEHLLDSDEDVSQVSSRPTSYLLDMPKAADSNCCVSINYTTPHTFSDRMGLFMIQPRDPSTTPPFAMVTISYEPQINQISLHELHDENSPFFPLCLASIDHNILYYLKNDNGKPRLWITDSNALTCHRSSQSMDTQLPREAATRVYSYAHGLTLRGDRDFILMVDENVIKVWCFNESIQLPADT